MLYAQVSQQRLQGPKNTAKTKPQDDLKGSIIHLIEEFEKNPSESRAIISLSNQFGIKRRRLYDIVNVFSSIGCCSKVSLDNVLWLGKDKIPEELKNQAEKRDLFNPALSLDKLFDVDACIGINNLTVCFLLLFIAMKNDKIDIRFAGQFLSRNSGRYKTTLCKLYQICYILNALGVTSKSEQVCEVKLNTPYMFVKPQEDSEPKEGVDISSISSLLNNHNKSTVEDYIQKRRDELAKNYIANVAERDAVLGIHE